MNSRRCVIETDTEEGKKLASELGAKQKGEILQSVMEEEEFILIGIRKDGYLLKGNMSNKSLTLLLSHFDGLEKQLESILSPAELEVLNMMKTIKD